MGDQPDGLGLEVEEQEGGIEMYSLGDRARYVNKSRIERIRCLEGLALARLFRGDRGQQQLLQRFLVSGKVQTRHSCREPPFISRADFQRFLAAIVSQCAPQNLYSLPRHKRPILSDVHIHLNGPPLHTMDYIAATEVTSLDCLLFSIFFIMGLVVGFYLSKLRLHAMDIRIRQWELDAARRRNVQLQLTPSQSTEKTVLKAQAGKCASTVRSARLNLSREECNSKSMFFFGDNETVLCSWLTRLVQSRASEFE